MCSHVSFSLKCSPMRLDTRLIGNVQITTCIVLLSSHIYTTVDKTVFQCQLMNVRICLLENYQSIYIGLLCHAVNECETLN